MAVETSTPSTTWSHTAGLNLVGRFALVGKLLFFLPKVCFSVIWEACKNRKLGFKSWSTLLIRQGAQMYSSLSSAERRFLTKPTGLTIAKYCKVEGISHETVSLNTGEFGPATLHFVGCTPKTPGNTLLYLHGGGYISPMAKTLVGFAHAAAMRAASNLVILEYTLAPDLKYPGQLAQAAAAMRHLLEKHEPSEIVIGGDSSGANLALSILAHLRQPHPLVPPIFEGEQRRIRGAFCISPRCSHDHTALSYTANASKDIVSRETIEIVTSNWEPKKEDVWATPLAATGDFWHRLYAEQVLLTAGTDEVYVDDIKGLAELMGEKNQLGTKVELVLCAEEIHTQAILDFSSKNWDGVMLKVLFGWLQNLQ